MLFFLEQEKAVLCDYKKLSSLQAELLVNTTPVGMFPHNEKMPIESKIIDSFNVVIDIIYNPIETTLLLEAKKQGKRSYDVNLSSTQSGRMLVRTRNRRRKM